MPEKSIADKIIELGGKLAAPASTRSLVEIESGFGIRLPGELRDFLLEHDGTVKDTDEGIWRFWPSSQIRSFLQQTHSEYFHPDPESLREIDPEARSVRLSGEKLILFADALFDTPIYGYYYDPGHPCHGMVFDTTRGRVSSKTFAEWVEAFVTHGEDALLFPEAA